MVLLRTNIVLVKKKNNTKIKLSAKFNQTSSNYMVLQSLDYSVLPWTLQVCYWVTTDIIICQNYHSVVEEYLLYCNDNRSIWNYSLFSIQATCLRRVCGLTFDLIVNCRCFNPH